MRRLQDILGGVVIGVGIFGLFACFCDKGFSLSGKLVYFCAILCGILSVASKFS